MISLPHVAKAEETIAHRLRYIGNRLRRIRPRRLAKLMGAESIQLNDEQRAAVTAMASSRITILTGDPGTGKTVTIKALSAILEQEGYVIYLVAPTGRAAARITEATGRPAQTLHRLLHNHERRQPLRELLIPSGIVEEASGDGITVRFGDRRVTYDQDSLADLAPGYAITIHPSQGSEYPFVIIPIHECQGIMLTRELLYTALTRGKRMVVLIGSRRAFSEAITSTRSHCLTGLKDLLTPQATVITAKKRAA
jgi:ATP-dependent exoDNAse (exonuclease V) alpha subunit